MSVRPDSPYDPTRHDPHMLVPPTTWVELKCKRPDPKALVRGRDQLVIHRPRVPFLTHYEDDRWVFTPLALPDPPWVVVGGFLPDTYVLESFTAAEGGESLFMWDLNTGHWRPGETIGVGPLTVMR